MLRSSLSIIIDLFRNDYSKNINPLDLSINVYQKINIQNKIINYLYESYFRNFHFVLRKRLLSGTTVFIFRNLEFTFKTFIFRQFGNK
jgi:hypothetical protein